MIAYAEALNRQPHEGLITPCKEINFQASGELLAALEARGISIEKVGSDLDLWPAAALDATILAEVRAHKAELLQLLSIRVERPLHPLAAAVLIEFDALILSAQSGQLPNVTEPIQLRPGARTVEPRKMVLSAAAELRGMTPGVSGYFIDSALRHRVAARRDDLAVIQEWAF